MTSSDTPWIARFLRDSGSVGGGLLLSGGHVLTCAHVVNAALGRRDRPAERPGENVVVDFPLQGVEPRFGSVVAWCPPGELGEGDVAIVKLDSGQMPHAAPMTLTDRLFSPDEALRLFGFPSGRPAGVWKGELRWAGPMVGAWQQLSARGDNDYKLQAGFSGCPILDFGGAVVGIFAQAEQAPAVDAGSFIPVAVAGAAVSDSDGIALPIVEVGAATPRLRRDYIDPARVFRRLDLDSFTGRDWLLEDLDTYLTDDSLGAGAWILIAEAALGKSAFMAHLARAHNYPHVFMEQARGAEGTTRATKSLAVQLITRYQIPPYFDQDLLPERLAGLPDFLSRIFEETATRLAPGERLPILIDALDEADHHLGGNVLGLPSQLPDGIFLVASSRPAGFRLLIEPPPRRVNIRTPENEHDIREYLEGIVTKPWLHEQLDAAGVPAAEFAQAVATRCEGNWMYLHYLFDDLRSERRPELLDLDRLPAGLAGYYAKFWLDWRERPDWTSTCRPLLATLAAAAEPLTVETLTTWSWVSADEEVVKRLLREDWAAFVQQLPTTPRLFQPYHTTLRDYLRGDLRIEYPTPAEEWLAEDLEEASVEAHKRIVQYVNEQCHGDLPTLDDGYGRKHLSFHMCEAGDSSALRSLVESPEWFHSQDRFSPDGAYFLADLSEAWRSTRGWTLDGSAPMIATLQQDVWCALAVGSVREGSSSIPKHLVPQLVCTRLWTAEQALTAVRMIPDLFTRADRLFDLLDALDGDVLSLAESDLVETLLKLAEAAGGPSEGEHWPQEAEFVWSRVLPALSSAAWGRTLAGLSRVSNEAFVADALALLVTNAGSQVAVGALQRADNFEFENSKVIVLSAVAELGDSSTLEPLLERVRSLTEDGALKDSIGAVAESHVAAIDELAHETERIVDDDAFADAFAALVPHLTPDTSERLLKTRIMNQPSPAFVRLLVALSRHRPDALEDAVRLARDLPAGEVRARGLAEAALGDVELAHQALLEIERLADDDQVYTLLHRLNPALERGDDLRDALRLALRLESWKRNDLLEDLSGSLTDDMRADALRQLKGLDGSDDKSTLRAIVAVAPQGALLQVLQTLKRAPNYQRDEPLARLIERLPDTLLLDVVPALRGLIGNEHSSWPDPVSTIAPRLTGATARRLLDLLRHEPDEPLYSDSGVARRLPLIAAKLNAADHDLAIQMAAALTTPHAKVQCLLELRTLRLTGNQDPLALAVEAANNASEEDGRAACLSAVAQHVESANEKKHLLSKALASARVIDDEADALENLLPLLRSDPVRMGSLLLDLGRRIDDFDRRKRWLTAGVKYAEGDDATVVFDYMFRVAAAETTDAFEWLAPLLDVRRRDVRIRGFDALATILAKATRITLKQIIPLFDAAAELDREPPVPDTLRLLHTTGSFGFSRSDFREVLQHLLPRIDPRDVARSIEHFDELSARSAAWSELCRAAAPELRQLALDDLRAALRATDQAVERASIGISLLELDPQALDRSELLEISFRGAVEAHEWGIQGPPRDELLQSLSSLLSPSEIGWMLDHVGELMYADQWAAVLAAIARVVEGDDLDRAARAAEGLARYPQLYGGAITALVARLCELGDWQRGSELADTVEHPDWRVRAALEPLMTRTTVPAAELVKALRDVVAVPPRTLTQIRGGSRSWTINTDWKSQAAKRILEALKSEPSELERAVEIINEGGLLPDCFETIIALATDAKSGHLPRLIWSWTLDASATRRSALIARLATLLDVGCLLCPALEAGDLGECVLDILRRWP